MTSALNILMPNARAHGDRRAGDWIGMAGGT